MKLGPFASEDLFQDLTGVNAGLSVGAVIVAGYLSDKVKFRYLFTVSFLLRAIGFFGFTHIAGPFTAPLLTDYVEKDSRGAAAAWVRSYPQL